MKAQNFTTNYATIGDGFWFHDRVTGYVWVRMIISQYQVTTPTGYGDGAAVTITASVGAGVATCPLDPLPAQPDTYRTLPPIGTPAAAPPFEAEAASVPRDDAPCAPAVVNCGYGLWSPWALCAGSCSNSTSLTSNRTRTRSIVYPAANGGMPCDNSLLSEVADCTIAQCTTNQDCIVTSWSDWSLCTTDLRGNATRQRDIVIQNVGTGQPCPTQLIGVMACSSVQLPGSNPSSAAQLAAFGGLLVLSLVLL